MSEKKEFRQKPTLGLVVQCVALVAAVFSLIICVLLVADHVRLTQMDPLNDPHLLELRKELAESTGDNEALIEQVRTYDFYARRAFFSNQAQRRMGGWLLLGGATVCFAALALSRLWKPKLPTIGKPDAPDHWELNSLFRQLMAGAGIVLLAVSLFLAFAVQSDLAVLLGRASDLPEQGRQNGGGTDDVPQASSLPLVDLSTGWPSLRGPGNIGVAKSESAPTEWDIESGEGVLWRVELPVHGYNSPIVWSNRVFMTGGDEEGLEVFCYDADSGEELWAAVVDRKSVV